MQKSDGNDEISLKVPKLKLKLSQPFQNPIESEQSSTESDSDSDNENYDDEHVSHDHGNVSNEAGPIEKELDQQLFLHPETEVQPYSYAADDSILNTENTKNVEESANESGSSTKNTSVDSDEKSICVEDNEYQKQQEFLQIPPDEMLVSSHLQVSPQIQSMEEQTSNLEHTNFTQDTSIMTNVNVSYFMITIKYTKY